MGDSRLSSLTFSRNFIQIFAYAFPFLYRYFTVRHVITRAMIWYKKKTNTLFGWFRRDYA